MRRPGPSSACPTTLRCGAWPRPSLGPCRRSSRNLPPSPSTSGWRSCCSRTNSARCLTRTSPSTWAPTVPAPPLADSWPTALSWPPRARCSSRRWRSCRSPTCPRRGPRWPSSGSTLASPRRSGGARCNSCTRESSTVHTRTTSTRSSSSCGPARCTNCRSLSSTLLSRACTLCFRPRPRTWPCRPSPSAPARRPLMPTSGRPVRRRRTSYCEVRTDSSRAWIRGRPARSSSGWCRPSSIPCSTRAR
mmetsp:Transcript_20304/g.63655  ORF Transcript_20304/g.63655 Transcript_20304/m.63655 type:complete len:247 (-) Transcript_20304:296-1036(-)